MELVDVHVGTIQDWLILSSKLLEESRYIESINAITVALQFHPTSVGLYQLLASAYIATGNDTSAIAAYQRAIELNPKDSTLLEAAGDLYVSMGDIDGALRCYTGASILHPTFSHHLLMKGKMYVERKDFMQAIRMYQRALDVQEKWDSDRELGTFNMHDQNRIKNEINRAYASWSKALRERAIFSGERESSESTEENSCEDLL